MYLKSTPLWMFSSCKTSKGKNKDFARQNKFFKMRMPMPTSMPMLIPRCRCRDFRMANLKLMLSNFHMHCALYYKLCITTFVLQRYYCFFLIHVIFHLYSLFHCVIGGQNSKAHGLINGSCFEIVKMSNV